VRWWSGARRRGRERYGARRSGGGAGGAQEWLACGAGAVAFGAGDYGGGRAVQARRRRWCSRGGWREAARSRRW